MTSEVNFSRIDISSPSAMVDSPFVDPQDEELIGCQNFEQRLPGMTHYLTTPKRKVELTQFRVVYLDDSVTNLKTCRAMFKALGIGSFFGVRLRQEMIDLLEQESGGMDSFDLCILDHNLDPEDTVAGFTGPKVAQEINPGLNKKTVMMLYSTDFGTFKAAEEATGNDFSRMFHLILQKPANPRRMKALLEDVYEFHPPLNEPPSYEQVRIVDEETQTAGIATHQSVEVNNIGIVDEETQTAGIATHQSIEVNNERQSIQVINNVGLCSCGTSICCVQ